MQNKKIVWIALSVCLLLMIAVVGVALAEGYKVEIQLPGNGTVFLEAGETQALPVVKAYATGLFRPQVELEASWAGEISAMRA